MRTAILLGTEPSGAARRARLAGVPVFLRAVLCAQRAGLEQVIVVSSEHPGRMLGKDPRVRLEWRWCPLRPEAAGNELAAWRQGAQGLDEDYVVLFADSLFDAGALRALCQAGLEGKLLRAGVSPEGGDEESGNSLFLCSRKLLEAAEGAEGAAGERLEALAARLAGDGRADRVEVSGNIWRRTREPRELARVEGQLIRLSLKPSDGIYARFNKLVVAGLLIRAMLRTPLTPNFFTGLGIFLAVLSGWTFAQGGYWWGLAGAVGAYLSSLMDHVDGMVARMKFQETDFGTWFETAADFTSYLFIFGGLAVGLYRETGYPHHLLVGGLFIFGTVASLLTTSHQRTLASPDNLADYANRIYARLEENRGNFFHWFTRQCSFLTRRAVLPYVVFMFCLLDLRVFLLAGAALGGNLVWVLTLYNNRLFRLRPRLSAAGASKGDGKEPA